MNAELTRTVRFCLRGDGSLDADAPGDNTYAAWPAMRGLGRYYELHVTCAGAVDQPTGYMVNIKVIDQAVRRHVLPVIAEAARRGADPPMGALMRGLIESLADRLPRAVARLTFQLTPTHSFSIEGNDMAHVTLAQQYDFSAAHRLHVPALSESENRDVFGKCNNPSGHGHNYKVEVAVRAPVGEDGTVIQVHQLDAVVDRTIIERFDHKHLNIDAAEFADLNPSVENIARTIYDLLTEPIKQLGAAVQHVRVWETEKTVCTYAG